MEPNSQLSTNSRGLPISDPSVPAHVGQSSRYAVSGDNVENGTCHQQADLPLNHPKKLQDDLQELGHKIKHHDDNVKYLKFQLNDLEESIVDMHVAIGKHYTWSSTDDLSHEKSEEEVIKSILKYEGSAAAIYYSIKSQPEPQVSYQLTKDVVGIVATLGKVEDANLSRLLSEYLGQNTMLAVVCKTYEGVKALETYNSKGLINESMGIHALGASIGKHLTDSFLAVSLDKLRSYRGEYIADDPQQRLDLYKPKSVDGEIIPGFLGFAVNMINIDQTNLIGISSDGRNLRDTLFYHLFSNMQVYKTREDMLKALPYIPNGAISLDGGIIKRPGVYSLGQRRRDIDVMFPVDSISFNLPEGYFEIEERVKETKWKKNRLQEDMRMEQSLLDLAKFSYEKKKQEFVQFLAKNSSFVSQNQVGR